MQLKAQDLWVSGGLGEIYNEMGTLQQERQELVSPLAQWCPPSPRHLQPVAEAEVEEDLQSYYHVERKMTLMGVRGWALPPRDPQGQGEMCQNGSLCPGLVESWFPRQPGGETGFLPEERIPKAASSCPNRPSWEAATWASSPTWENFARRGKSSRCRWVGGSGACDTRCLSGGGFPTGRGFGVLCVSQECSPRSLRSHEGGHPLEGHTPAVLPGCFPEPDRLLSAAWGKTPPGNAPLRVTREMTRRSRGCPAAA